MELISVIVPVYNAEKYFDICVQSIADQTYKNLEIILVDDGSPDNCPAICDKWAKKDSRIKVIHKENGGVSSARNTGIENANGAYIGFVDSDDYIELDMIEALHKLVKQDDFDVAVCNNYNRNAADEIYALGGDYKDSVHRGKGVLEAFVKGEDFDPFSNCNKLFKMSLIKSKNIRFDENVKYGEDFLFNYMFFREAEKCVSVAKCFYNYRIGRCGSATSNITRESVMRWQNTYKRVLAEEKNNTAVYDIALKKHTRLVLRCIQELLSSNIKELAKQCYPLMASEIQLYGRAFLKLNGVGMAVKLSVLLIMISPAFFKAVYMFYKKL